MRTLFHEGDSVRLIRNVRNDGTFPGTEIGELLIKRGSVGYVQSIGTFLQDQIIYSVHFMEKNSMIGCREEELIGADEAWLPSRYEFRDKVFCNKPLAINGEIIVETGTQGEIVSVISEAPGVFQYHVRFPGRTLQVPESVLDAETILSQQKELAE